MPINKIYVNSLIDPLDGQKKFYRDLDATHIEDVSDPSSILGSIKSTADTAKTIAEGATRAMVFDTIADMEVWLKNSANKGKLKIGDNLYIKAIDVPDFWVSAVYETATPEGFYYNYSRLEIGQVKLSNVVTTDADQSPTIDTLFGALNGTSLRIDIRDFLLSFLPTGGDVSWVDLHLPSGRLWADRNLGASSPTDWGDFYCWGATAPYDFVRNSYDLFPKSAAYKLGNDLIGLNDVATLLLGTGCRIPSYNEFLELKNNTTYSVETIEGVKCGVFHSLVDTNVFITLPLSGYCDSTRISTRNEQGYYWTRSFISTINAWRCALRYGTTAIEGRNRANGMSIRPVNA